VPPGWEVVVSDNGWESVRRERLVKNELAFRDYNNRRVALEQQAVAIEPDVVDEAVPFVCECGDADCAGALTLTVEEYEAAHSTPNRFTVKPGHLYEEAEFVTEQHDRYWVVEKHPGEMPAD
jgi:5-bromo-4-chloroindolyl phosphate hydrolysis protein